MLHNSQSYFLGNFQLFKHFNGICIWGGNAFDFDLKLTGKQKAGTNMNIGICMSMRGYFIKKQQSVPTKSKRRKYRYIPHVDTTDDETEEPRARRRKIPTAELIRKKFF